MIYDVVIIGGGPGGYTAAIRASQKGLKTALIEKAKLGGTCLNLGCIPTKSLLNASKLYYKMKHSNELGIEASGLSYNLSTIYEGKNQIVEKLVTGIQHLIDGNQIDFFHAHASFLNEHQIELQDTKEIIEGKQIIIATGSKPRMFPFAGNDLANVYTSDDVMRSPIDAKQICIVGGGVIGVELADFYSDLGCAITIIESEKQILPTLDRELSLSLAAYLKKKGVTILTNTRFIDNVQEESYMIHYQVNDEIHHLENEALIIAVGREANTKGLALEKANIQTNHGFITVNHNYQTNIPHIYAIGDASGAIQLAHVASFQGKNCISYILNEGFIAEEPIVPYCIYTGIEIAYVGMSEQSAKENGITTKTHKILMNTNGKHLIETEERAFLKLLVDEEDHILGAQLFCKQATELVSYFTLAIQKNLSVAELKDVIFPHPTISEVIGESFEMVLGEAIHQIKKR
jgi:dihydrolipoamide dehydrogenase